MLLDAENGRPIEVEAIVGEVVRMAKTRGVAVPVSLNGYTVYLASAELIRRYQIGQRTEMLYALLLVVQNQTLRKLESRS